MDVNNFKNQLDQAKELMREENYKKALKLLKKLKDIEGVLDFDYNLTHKLYQLLSNCQSLLNQQVILKYINNVKLQNKNSLTLQDLKRLLKSEINLEESILGREVELLILRGILSCKIEGNKIIF